MKKSYIVMAFTFLIALGLISKSFIFDESIKIFLLAFSLVGCGLGLLRIFVNNSIKRMKGKGWKSKVLFFAVLLGIGLPFQSWFRTKVLFSMSSEFLPGSIFMLVISVIFITTFFGYMKDINSKNKVEIA